MKRLGNSSFIGSLLLKVNRDIAANIACRKKRSRCFVIFVEVEKQLKLHNIIGLRYGL
jgi:hypothetical protein